MTDAKLGPLDRALELILSLDGMTPSANLPQELDTLFADLSQPAMELHAAKCRDQVPKQAP